MTIKFLVLGGYLGSFFGRGGSADFIFMGARISLILLTLVFQLLGLFAVPSHTELTTM